MKTSLFLCALLCMGTLIDGAGKRPRDSGSVEIGHGDADTYGNGTKRLRTISTQDLRLHDAITHNDKQRVINELSAGADITIINEEEGGHALHIAIELEAAEEILELLLAHSCESHVMTPKQRIDWINAYDDGGSTPALAAAQNGLISRLQLLLAHGANTHAQDLQTGDTILHCLARCEHAVRIIPALLCAYPMSPFILNSRGHNPARSAYFVGQRGTHDLLVKYAREQCVRRLQSNYRDQKEKRKRAAKTTYALLTSNLGVPRVIANLVSDYIVTSKTRSKTPGE